MLGTNTAAIQLATVQGVDNPVRNWLHCQWKAAFLERQQIQIEIKAADLRQCWITGTRELRDNQDLENQALQQRLTDAHKVVRCAKQTYQGWVIYQLRLARGDKE